MKSCCVVVIGHVDHGKTSLVRALSGIETDRLAEEKARGLSILPGFAHKQYSGGIIDLIDAPGHRDFIQAMVSGATGARAALVVIAATEGVAAQTREHLRIISLLGIADAVVAVTKSDLVTPSEVEAHTRSIQTTLAKNGLAPRGIIACSAQTGAGIASLEQALERLLDLPPQPIAPQGSFLPIDRAFSLPGKGTVVTGTLLGQKMSLDESLVLLPAGTDVSMRGMQSRGTPREQLCAGERVAINLRGVAVTDIPRGAVLAAHGCHRESMTIDVHLQALQNASTPMKHMQNVRVLFGTTSAVARLRLFDGSRILPAQTGFGQLRFKKPVAGYAGQRAVLRALSPAETLGGATFLDVCPPPLKMTKKVKLDILQAAFQSDAAALTTAICRANGGIAALDDIARLACLSHERAQEIVGPTALFITPDTVTTGQIVDTCEAAILSTLATYHTRHPLRTGAPLTQVTPKGTAHELAQFALKSLLSKEAIRQSANIVAVFTHSAAENLNETQMNRMQFIETAFQMAKLSPPGTDAVNQSPTDQELIDLLIDTKRLITLRNVSLKQDLIFHADTLNAAAITLAEHFAPSVTFTTGQARTALQTSRRVIVPLLEHFDKTGVTIRNADMRQMTA